jgi:putative oxidoreductase
MDRLQSAGILVSRVLLSVIFLFSGMLKIFFFATTQDYMARFGMRMTGLFLVLAILFELAGGLSILLGYYPRVGSLLLILYLAPVTLVFHRNFADPGQIGQCAKNLAIMGGLLALLSVGGGEFAVKGRRGPGGGPR